MRAIKTDTERVVEIPWLLQHVGHPGRLLDVGSAGAMYLDELAAAADELWLIDTQPMRDIPHRAHALRMNVTEIPDEWEGYFDAISCVSVLDHVGLDAYDNQAQPGLLQHAIFDIWRALRDGGRLLLTVPAGRDLLTTHGNHGGQRVFSMATLRRLFPQPDLWIWRNVRFWKLDVNLYLESDEAAIQDAGYAGHRAAAVVAIEMEAHK